MTDPTLTQLFTDGACLGNPGPGGWAALLRDPTGERWFQGGDRHTTNNRMELLAAIVPLEEMAAGGSIEVTTDSQYVKQGIESWIPQWKRRGWRTAEGAPVKNQDLWMRLDAATSRHRVRFAWVRGHSGHPDNERVDQRARHEAQRQKAAP